MADPNWAENFAKYRSEHGAETLTRYHGRDRNFICKKTDGQSANLVEIGTHEEITVSYEDFKKNFFLIIMDWEPAFHFASGEKLEALKVEYEKEKAAFQYCLGV